MPDSAVTQYQTDPQAETNWQRYTYGLTRGHRSYTFRARRLEGFYVGGGMQWSQADVQKLKDTGDRPWYEWNGIMPAVNAALGYQINNRMDIQFVPRGGAADSSLAAIRSKVAMQICDQNKYHWLETQMFADGLIEQRGYIDVRMCFDQNVFGEVSMETLDPRDVIPDPDAKTYDPKDWFDVTTTRWYTADEVEGFYGPEARAKLIPFLDSELDWGEADDAAQRNKFGDELARVWDAFTDDTGARRFRVIDRQRWEYKLIKVAIYPTGDIEPCDTASPEQLAEYMQQGAKITKRLTRTVRWTVTTRWSILFDDTSPYDRFTVIPYFCYFRRGLTRGMVDNAISPQEVLNKAISQFVHILNTTANSGWIVQENSLVSHSVDDLEGEGSKTGLVLIYKQGAEKPVKIEPNAIPQGLDRLIEHAIQMLKDLTVPDAARGLETPEISGIAIQSKQFAARQQLAVPLDNLSRTRYMVGDFVDWLIGHYYDNHRLFCITEIDPVTGQQVDKPLEVNVYDTATGTWSSDMTSGKYDTVIAEQPTQVTFENSQFLQALEIRKAGVAVPDNVVIKHSNLVDKAEILQQMANAPAKVDPLTEAKTALTQAQASLAKFTADKVQADTANVRITSLFGAVQAGQAVATMPQIAPIADQIARSAGVRDQDTAPLIQAPAAQVMTPQVIPNNTNPLSPTPPATGDVGVNAGIEGGGEP